MTTTEEDSSRYPLREDETFGSVTEDSITEDNTRNKGVDKQKLLGSNAARKGSDQETRTVKPSKNIINRKLG